MKALRRSSASFGLRRMAQALVLAGGLMLAGVPAAFAQPIERAAFREAAQDQSQDLASFYRQRDWRPLWTANGGLTPAAFMLLEQMRDAAVDGVKAKSLKAKDLDRVLDRAETGDPDALLRAEFALSRALVAYVRAMRAARHAEMSYESPALAPVVPSARSVLDAAAAAPSLDDYIRQMGWMNPFYAPLRDAYASGAFGRDSAGLLRLNLERLRAIPAQPGGRQVIVDAANARLYMIEDGRVVDSMRVVVGKPDNPTPMLAGFIRFAQVNPYWNVPPDLVQGRIAQNVLDRGVGYLKTGGYQVLDSWEDDARLLDPRKVDWPAVASGLQEVRVRQLPGGDNFMGKVKFMFPNSQGIYLHDTPDKQLMVKDERQFSSGCVRLEDAARFGKWLFGKPLPTKTKKPEQRIDLPEVVPVYITYLTATAAPGRGIAFAPDVYGRDAPLLARAGGGSANGR